MRRGVAGGWTARGAPASSGDMADIDTDILIVGGGLTGLSAALALEQAGFAVCVVDREAPATIVDPAFDGRASAIAYASWRMLGALGVAERIGEVQPIEEILVSDGRPGDRQRSGAASMLTLHFDHRELGEGASPLGWMIENRRMRVALADAVRARIADGGPIDWRAPAVVTDLAVDGPNAAATLADGTVIRARLALGCDGRSSQVRRTMGVRAYGWSYGQTGIVATAVFEAPHGGVAHEYFLPNGPFAILPLTGNRASLVWTEKTAGAKALMSLDEAAFGAELQRRFGRHLGQVRIEGPRWSYPLSLDLAAEWTRPRMALVGDAAHGIHPIAGQGLNLGLKDVAALAQVLAEAAALGEDIGSTLVLERYARWRRFDTMTLAAACDGFVRLFSTDAAPVRTLRTLGLGIVDALAPARKLFMRHAGGDAGDLPLLLRGERLA